MPLAPPTDRRAGQGEGRQSPVGTGTPRRVIAALRRESAGALGARAPRSTRPAARSVPRASRSAAESVTVVRSTDARLGGRPGPRCQSLGMEITPFPRRCDIDITYL